MKSSPFFAFGLAAFISGFSPSLMAEDWTTTDGKVYQNVSVVKVEPDAVTITDHDGGALVPLAKLPPDLQKRYSYDPAKAKVAADARAQANAKNAVVLQTEINQARDQKQAAIIALDPRNPPVTPTKSFVASHSASATFDPMGEPPQSTQTAESNSSSPENATSPESQASQPPTTASTPTNHSPFNLASDPLATDPNDPNHHSMDSLVDINSRLKDDHPSPNRHTMASLLLASSYLMPDPLDPTHHSTDDLLQSASNLSKPENSSGHP